MNIMEQKNGKFRMLSVVPLRFAVLPVSRSFFKTLFTPRSTQRLFGNFLVSFFVLHNL